MYDPIHTICQLQTYSATLKRDTGKTYSATLKRDTGTAWEAARIHLIPLSIAHTRALSYTGVYTWWYILSAVFSLEREKKKDTAQRTKIRKSIYTDVIIWYTYNIQLLSSCGYYAVSSVSVFAATCLAYDIYWYASWYVHTLISPFYFCLRCTILFSYYCVYYLLFLFVFLPEAIFLFRSRVIGACPVTTGCIVAMS